jgi:WD40 repeat protein
MNDLIPPDLINFKDKLNKIREIQCDPYYYAYDHFEKLLNKIHLREARIIEAVHAHFDSLINQVLELRDKAKLVEIPSELMNLDLNEYEKEIDSLYENESDFEQARQRIAETETYFDELIDPLLDNKTYELSEQPKDLNHDQIFGHIIEKIKKPKIKKMNLVKTIRAHSWGVYALAKSKRGELISGSYDHSIKVWSVPAGECKMALKGHSSFVNALIVDENGALYSGSEDGMIKIWNLDTYECVRTFKAHDRGVNALVIDPNGHLVSASGDGSIKVWDVQYSVRCVCALIDQNGSVQKLVIDADGKLISTSRNGCVKIWDLVTKKCTKTLNESANSIVGVAIDKNNDLVTASIEGEIKKVNLNDERTHNFSFLTQEKCIMGILFCGNGQLVIWTGDGAVKLCDLDKQDCVQSFASSSNGHVFAESLIFFNDNYLVTGLSNGTIEIWHIDYQNESFKLCKEG